MSILVYLFISGLVILLTYIINNHRKNRRFWKLLDDFYGDKTLPLIGNAHQLGTISEDLLWTSYEMFERAGFTTYKFLIGHTVFVNLCDPDTVEVLLSSNKELNKMTEYSFFNEWLGDGLLLSSGAKWRTRRKIITPTFHFKILEQFVKVFNDNGKILIQELSKKKGNLIDIYTFINYYALDVICETAMGVSINAQTDSNSEYVKAVHSMCKLMNSRLLSVWKRIPLLYKLSSDYTRYCKNLKTLHDMTTNVIKTRRTIMKDEIEKVKNGGSLEEEEDEFIRKRKKIAFLDLLLLSKLPDGSFLTDEDVREETDTFMFEGHDTTTSAISFAIYSLANNPDVQQKALEEVLSIMGDDPNKEITYKHLQDMKYMDMVIKETLRLYPSVPSFGRDLESDLALPDGKIIPAGCRVIVDPFELGRNPRHFPDHEKFDPERFSPENTSGKNPYMSVPFSAGSRNCIGQKFAMLELKSVLAKILMNFELVSGGEGATVELVAEIILKAKNGVKIIVKDRKHKN